MTTNSYVTQNGVSNGSNGYHQANSSIKRPPTVDEALPYSPLSSVVPFNSDVIPVPKIGLRSSTSLFATATDRESARRGLESLNEEASHPSQTSQRLEQKLKELKQLLQPDNIPQYNFKTAPKITSEPNQSHPKLSLTPFAQMLYDTTTFECTYPSPSSPSTQAQNNRVGSQNKSPSNPPQSRQAVRNQIAYDENSSIKVHIPIKKQEYQVVTPPQPSPPRPSTNIAVVIPAYQPGKAASSQPVQSSAPIVAQNSHMTARSPAQQQARLTAKPAPNTPTRNPVQWTAPVSNSNVKFSITISETPPTFRPEDYEVIAESPETPPHLSTKRKRAKGDGFEDELTMSLDQSEKADEAFKKLRVYVQEIFDAEDDLRLDGVSNAFFTSTSDGPSLSISAQTKVESQLQKIIEVGRFSQIPLDDLIRLQKLSEGGLKDAETVDVKIEESMGDSEVEAWLQNVSRAELGLKSARTLLRMMAGGREDKQIYSEDVTKACLNAFKNVMEASIIPTVEMRSSGTTATLFKLLSAQKKVITGLLTQCKRVISLFATLVANIELSETVINTLEFTASRLIFVENAHSEKDSVLGIAKFDALRVEAMNVVEQIFLNKPSQRQGIFNEILTSLEKLPVTKQSARQFKLAEGGSIQLVSALIMRLIQTSASKSDDSKENRGRNALEALNGLNDVTNEPNQSTLNSEAQAEQQPVTAIQELRDVVSPLLKMAADNAEYVAKFIVGRAMKSTKTGDTPYRNLLDLFVEDFITCLPSTDWPAAELLLRILASLMMSLAAADKTATQARNMAVELLGSMGAAISDLISNVRKAASSLENSDTDLGQYLSRLAETSLEKSPSLIDLVSWACGPFRTCLEFIDNRSSLDPQLSSAVGYNTAEWASKTCAAYNETGEDPQTEREFGGLAYRLRMMISDKQWLSTEYSFDSVSAGHARLAYGLTLLQSPFCGCFSRILDILLTSMTTELAGVRSRSLKSVTTVLETDPTILDRDANVMRLLLECSTDPSPLVRESALGLIGKCMSLRPALEDGMIPSILERTSDNSIGVRKRSMKLLKDVYLRNNNREVRSAIADSLLHRVADQDEGVQTLARQIIEEVWMSSFYQSTSTDKNPVQFKLAMADHVALMIKTLQRGSGVSTVLDKVLQSMLSNDSKFAAANFEVCTALVATMFESIIDNSASDGNNAPSARDALHVLTIFARSNAKLFTYEQIQLLLPYVANVRANDDLAIYRSVLIIFRHVLPHLPKVHNNFLASVRKELIQAVSNMGRTILDDLVACLWIISDVLGDFQHLTRLVLSTLTNLQKLKSINLKDPARVDVVRKLNRLLLITGMFGKHCNLDPQSGSFRGSFPTWKDNSVSKLMADTFTPFASPGQPLDVRKAALDAIGMVCQSWPKNFSSANIFTQFQAAFDEEDDEMRNVLEAIAMRAFKDFLLLEEKRSEVGAEALVGAAGDPSAKLGVMGGGQGDGVAIGIAQRFLRPIIRIALSRQDDQALLATEVIASITRQGLVHPKECATSLIALETSQNPKIAEIAFREHRAVHTKFESIVEKEYMRAVQLAYIYQRDVIRDTHGATLNPFVPKLNMMVEVLKESTPKNRTRFFENLCSRIDFDPEKMDVDDLPNHLDFSQFIIENMAFFEYKFVDELLVAITAMERVVAGTGTGIAHAIETEIFGVTLNKSSQIDENGQPLPVEPQIDLTRLRRLTASSMMLSSLWQARTYLRRQYGLTMNRREGKAKATVKDKPKSPVKVKDVNGDKFWQEISSVMNAFESKENMIKQCQSFVQLLNVDPDFKVAADGDAEDEGARLSTPSDDEANATPGPSGGSGRGRKRKAPGTPGGRKKRARSSSIPRSRGRPKGWGKRGSVDVSDDDDEDGWD